MSKVWKAKFLILCDVIVPGEAAGEIFISSFQILRNIRTDRKYYTKLPL